MTKPRLKKEKDGSITHWLYGKDNRKFKVKEETQCEDCIHCSVCNVCKPCKYNMEKFCKNYRFGNSKEKGCLSCTLRFTRYDQNSIPCFICKFFEEKIVKGGK